MKQWPNRLLVAGITCSIIGSVIFFVGIVLSTVGVTLIDKWGENNGMIGAGAVLIYLSIVTLLAEGIACWIVGAIFKSKYAKANVTQPAQPTLPSPTTTVGTRNSKKSSSKLF